MREHEILGNNFEKKLNVSMSLGNINDVHTSFSTKLYFRKPLRAKSSIADDW